MLKRFKTAVIAVLFLSSLQLASDAKSSRHFSSKKSAVAGKTVVRKSTSKKHSSKGQVSSHRKSERNAQRVARKRSGSKLHVASRVRSPRAKFHRTAIVIPTTAHPLGRQVAVKAKNVALSTNTVGLCYRGVKKALSAFGVHLEGGAAYMAKEQLANDDRFKQVPLKALRCSLVT
jgi:hypothetical protein